MGGGVKDKRTKGTGRKEGRWDRQPGPTTLPGAGLRTRTRPWFRNETTTFREGKGGGGEEVAEKEEENGEGGRKMLHSGVVVVWGGGGGGGGGGGFHGGANFETNGGG
jgi:hypothetical protein